jgi:peroxiredoxin Q/BCP
VIYGASFDSPEENKAFADKFSFNYCLLTCSPDMAVAYGAADPGQTEYPKRVGVVIGPDGNVKEWLPKVDAKSYPKDVLERI